MQRLAFRARRLFSSRPSISSVLSLKTPPEKSCNDILVHGWLRTIRRQKTRTFLEVNDGSCVDNLQIVLNNGTEEAHSLLQIVKDLHVGAALVCRGKLTVGGGKQALDFIPKEISCVGGSSEAYPLQKKGHSLEFLRTIPQLRTRTNLGGVLSRIRASAAAQLRRSLDEMGFFEVHASVLTLHDCEGGGEVFYVDDRGGNGNAVDGNGNAVDGNGNAVDRNDTSDHYFKQPAKLSVSAQLQAEVFASALKRVYSFGPTFRAERSHTPHHLAEFWMLEPEMAFCGAQEAMDVCEKLIRDVAARLLVEREHDIDFLQQRVDSQVRLRLHELVSDKQSEVGDLGEGDSACSPPASPNPTPFPRITFKEAMELLKKEPKKKAWGVVEEQVELTRPQELWLCREFGGGLPVFCTEFPCVDKPFYMKRKGGTVEAFDLLVPGVGELVGGSARVSSLDALDKQLRDMGMDPQTYDWYRDLRKYGCAPSAGFGIGFDRLIVWLTGMKNVRDVVPFVRTVGVCHG